MYAPPISTHGDLWKDLDPNTNEALDAYESSGCDRTCPLRSVRLQGAARTDERSSTLASRRGRRYAGADDDRDLGTALRPATTAVLGFAWTSTG